MSDTSVVTMVKTVRLMCLTFAYAIIGALGVAYLYIGIVVILNSRHIEALAWLNLQEELALTLDPNTQLVLRSSVQLLGHLLTFVGMFQYFLFLRFFVRIFCLATARGEFTA